MDDQTEIIHKAPQVQGATTTVEKTVTESTTTVGKPKPNESHVASISVRALIALIVILTVCYMSIMTLEVKEPLYTLAGLIVGFFFGQQTKPKSQQ